MRVDEYRNIDPSSVRQQGDVRCGTFIPSLTGVLGNLCLWELSHPQAFGLRLPPIVFAQKRRGPLPHGRGSLFGQQALTVAAWMRFAIMNTDTPTKSRASGCVGQTRFSAVSNISQRQDDAIEPALSEVVYTRPGFLSPIPGLILAGIVFAPELTASPWATLLRPPVADSLSGRYKIDIIPKLGKNNRINSNGKVVD